MKQVLKSVRYDSATTKISYSACSQTLNGQKKKKVCYTQIMITTTMMAL